MVKVDLVSSATYFLCQPSITINFFPFCTAIGQDIKPKLETELYDSIVDFYKTGKSRIAEVEQKMIDNNITTEIIDPIGGTESPLSRIYGFFSEVKGPAGMQDGGFASIEEVLEYNNG